MNQIGNNLCSDEVGLEDAALNRSFIFVIGSPRSGTTWFQAMLAAHPKVAASVEMTLFDCYLAPLQKRWKEETDAIAENRWHQGLPVIWTQSEFDEFVTDFLDRAYRCVLARNRSATHVLDKQPVYARHVEEINRYIPNSKFIHVVRDGRDVVSSMIAARRDMGFGAATALDAAREWRDFVLSARKAAEFSDRYIEVRYEDLLSDCDGHLRRSFDFLDLEYDQEMIDAICATHEFGVMKSQRRTADRQLTAPEAHYRRGKAGSWKVDLTPFQRYQVELVGGDLLRELNYVDGDWACESLGERLQLKATIGWNAIQCLRRRVFGFLAR